LWPEILSSLMSHRMNAVVFAFGALSCLALCAEAQPPAVPLGRLNSMQGPGTGVLCLQPDGSIYGTTYGEGKILNRGMTFMDGTIYRLSPEGTLACVAYLPNFLFDPARGHDLSGLVRDVRGSLWGAMAAGGKANSGLIYRFDPATARVEVVVEFTGADGPTPGRLPYPKLVIDDRGFLWGVTREGGASRRGTVFKLECATGKFSHVLEFSGAAESNAGEGKYGGGLPTAGTLGKDGKSFWAALSNQGNGSIFRVETATGALTTVLTFTGRDGPAPGRYPSSGVVSDGEGFIWGTTLSGGHRDLGTVFKIEESTGKFTSIAQFEGLGSAATTGENPHTTLVSDGRGRMWGSTDGGAEATIFRISTGKGEFKHVAKFSSKDGVPRPSLWAGMTSDGKGTVWGTAMNGGPTAGGMIFKIDAAAESLSTAVEFPKDYGNQLSR
jgi:hypothetical protein